MPMKIVVETNLRRIPRCCRKCRYYRGTTEWGGRAYWNRNDGACIASGEEVSTAGITVSRQRLQDCPLREQNGGAA